MAFIESILNYLNPNKNSSIGIFYAFLFFLVLGSIAFYVYQTDYFQVLHKLDRSDIPNSSFNSQKGEIVILYFFAEWCPHCRNANVPYEDTANKYNMQTVNGYKIKFQKVDCSHVDDQKFTGQEEEANVLRKKYNVEGYPTIKMLKGTDTIDFDSKITKTALVEFIENMTKN